VTGGIPLALYVHLPWCAKKCPYCDFNSFSAGSEPPRARYIAALCADLDLALDLATDRPLTTIFIGGGTPSLFTPAEIASILDAVSARFAIAAGAEITMEANPGTVECGSLAGYHGAGVNRLSIGAQSFDDSLLAVLGRLHRAAAIDDTFREAREAGFDNINLDLMYALPGQDVDAACADVDRAIVLGPEHISWYQLTLEPNTVFYARPPAGLPSDALMADIEDVGAARLEDAGYARYEVSAWARDGRRCAHNLNYWHFGDYLAVGAGAHGKLTREGVVSRYTRPANPGAYMDALEGAGGTPELSAVETDDRVFEFMLNALRLEEGFSLEEFEARARVARSAVLPELDRLAGLGLVDLGATIKPTPLGRAHLNTLMAGFLAAERP
jgi:putative oxygen-independent coproporphyrinogen III oxidase